LTFYRNIQSCGRNTLRYKIEADELQECTVPWKRPDKGVGVDAEDCDESDYEEDFDFEAVC
jgi:hypothetical protein